jgi:hypothetical protein
VDVFDRATGWHVGRQRLGNIPCCEFRYTGYDTQAVALDDAVVATTPDGVRVFRPHPAGAKAFAEVTGITRALQELVARGDVDVSAFDAAQAKAAEAIRQFEAVIGSSWDPSVLPREDLRRMAGGVAEQIRALRTLALQPAITPPAGGFVGSARVVLSTPMKGAEIRFTLDGSDPAVKGVAYSGPIPLTGPVVVKVVADLPGRIGAGSPRVEAAYRPIEVRAAENVSGLAPGLAFAFADGHCRSVNDAAGFKVLETGVSRFFDISPWHNRDKYAVTFTGYVQVPTDGAYVFHITSDDGSALFIGDKRVADNDRHHPPQTRSGEIGLRAGLHPIKILYFDEIGDEMLKVEYEGPGVQRKPIPPSVLFHRP